MPSILWLEPHGTRVADGLDTGAPFRISNHVFRPTPDDLSDCEVIRLRAPLVLACLALLAGCDLPRDPQGTLDGARGGTLRVGVSEAPPWVVRNGEAVAGVEPELLRRFARSIGADVEWHWGPVADHMEALDRYELDVVAGGLTRDTPWKSHVGLTAPYHTDSSRVSGPAGAGRRSVRHLVLAVPPGENAFLMALENAFRSVDVAALVAAAGGAR